MSSKDLKVLNLKMINNHNLQNTIEDNLIEHEIPDRRRATTISELQKFQLIEVFILGRVEEYAKSLDKRNCVDLIQNMAIFTQLNKRQIRYQFNRYTMSVLLRKQVGGMFLKITVDLISAENDFIENNILSIMASIYSYFLDLNEISSLPTSIKRFLSRCYLAYCSFCDDTGASKKYLEHFHKNDENYLVSFVNFIRCALFPFYNTVWEQFSVIESRSIMKTSGNVLSDLECTINYQRTLLGQPSNKMYQLFASRTYIGDCITAEFNNDTLYRHITVDMIEPNRSKVLLTAPQYVRSATAGRTSTDRNCTEIISLLLQVFEIIESAIFHIVVLKYLQ